MPNNITNLLHVQDLRDIDYEKQSKDFKKFASSFKTKESDFDFNIVVPMPDTVNRGDISFDQMRELGPERNWSDWCRNHWGTKWNSYEVVWITQLEYLEFLVKFETAWSPPMPVLEALAARGYTVWHSWKDEGSDDWHGWEQVYPPLRRP